MGLIMSLTASSLRAVPAPHPVPSFDASEALPSEWSDLDLRDRMLERDETAWREFDRRFARLVLRCIHKVTLRFRSQLCDEDLREIHSQFLVDLTSRDMHRLRAYAPDRGSKLGTWIGMIATNSAWDYVRVVSRQPVTTSAKESDLDLGVHEEDPIEMIERKERWKRIDAVLRELSLRDRDFVRLYYVDGLSPEAIAEVMSISVKTVYSKKHKIRARLEQELAGLRVVA